MPVFHWMVQALEWLIAVAWLWRVLVWRRMWQRVPDLVRTRYADSTRSFAWPERDCASEKTPPIRNPSSMEAPLSPLSSRPKRSEVEGPAIPRAILGNAFFDRA